ncbi:MAG: ELM1/GtrOC1 family putative glycosyltransferase [Pseudomonadota bacterium]
MQILIVDEGHAGHMTQSRGIADALAARLRAEVAVLTAHLTLRGFLRPLLRWLTGRMNRGLPDFLLSLAYRWPRVLPARPDLIVTSGGQGVPLAVSLARRFRVPLVFCGHPDPYPASWFDAVLSPLPMQGHRCAIQTELLLTGMSPARVAGRGDAYRAGLPAAGGTQLGSVLVGGDSRSHRFVTADWEALAAGLNRLGLCGWRWLLTTSRRTPPEAEQLLREQVRPEYLLHAVWWHAKPEKVVLDFLGAADCVFVTQDSLSMVSEAISAGRPVVTLLPAQVISSAFLEQVLSIQEERRRLRRVPVSTLESFRFSIDDFTPVTADLAALHAQQICDSLQLAPRSG